jgi:hypothetical protein
MLDFPGPGVLCTVIHHRRWVTALSSRILGKRLIVYFRTVNLLYGVELRFVHGLLLFKY